MRVLHISPGNLFGGVETVLHTLARFQHISPNLEHGFAVCFKGTLSKSLETIGSVVHFLGEVRIRFPLTIGRSRKKLGQILRDQTYDAVVCHSSWPFTIFGPVVKKVQLPLILWLHSPPKMNQWLDRWASQTSPDMIVCNSSFTASNLSSIYPHTHHFVYYPPVASPQNALSEEEIHRIRREHQTSAEATVIIQVGRMEKCKGHDLHLEALARLSEVPGWVCWMVGGAQRSQDQKLEKELKARAKRLGIADRVHFLGHRFDVDKLLSAADIYCQPNTEPESFGISLIEALYAGLPVITTEMGGAKEIVTSSCGFLVEPEIESVCIALKSLISNQNLRLNLGKEGCSRAAELCEPVSQIRRLERFFDTVNTGHSQL